MGEQRGVQLCFILASGDSGVASGFGSVSGWLGCDVGFFGLTTSDFLRFLSSALGLDDDKEGTICCISEVSEFSLSPHCSSFD